MQRGFLIIAGAAFPLLFGACSSPPPVVSRLPSVPRVPIVQTPHTLPPVARHPIAASFDTMRAWTPRYITTGISTGIMVEFSGMKKGKQLNARYAILDVWRCPNGPATGGVVHPAAAPGDSGESAFVRLFATINDLRQAFFQTSAGRYMIRHTTPWADQRYIRDVIVRPGSYSIVTVGVLAPPATPGLNE